MSIPYPWGVDWTYAATDIVMPALIWLYVVAIVLILLDVAVKSARRTQDQWFRDTFPETATGDATAPETPGAISGPKDG